jgi:hypothetical protein
LCCTMAYAMMPTIAMTRTIAAIVPLLIFLGESP